MARQVGRVYVTGYFVVEGGALFGRAESLPLRRVDTEDAAEAEEPAALAAAQRTVAAADEE